MIQQTSLDSFKETKKNLYNLQKAVYESIFLLENPNNMDISIFLNKPINSITPRVNELYKKGLIRVSGQKIDSRTKRNTNYYNII
jgi:hypothetical protein